MKLMICSAEATDASHTESHQNVSICILMCNSWIRSL